MSNDGVVTVYQPLLLSIAHRMVKNLMDAEDIVQDTFLKFLSQPRESIENVKAYLVRSVINNCINHLKKLKQNAEELLDPIFHSEWLSQLDDRIQHIEWEHELSSAVRVVMEKLEPNERVVYMFREVFNFDYAEISEIVEKKKDNCRQLFCRAKQKMQEEKSRFSVSLEQHKQTFQAFVNSCHAGSFPELMSSLKEEVSRKFSD
jgi:RNA polymerase sigma-70 factor (ECF subfamily)